MLLRNDVLDVEREEIRIVLMHATILAAPLSLPLDEGTKGRIDHAVDVSESSSRALDFSNATKVPKWT